MLFKYIYFNLIQLKYLKKNVLNIELIYFFFILLIIWFLFSFSICLKMLRFKNSNMVSFIKSKYIKKKKTKLITIKPTKNNNNKKETTQLIIPH